MKDILIVKIISSMLFVLFLAAGCSSLPSENGATTPVHPAQEQAITAQKPAISIDFDSYVLAVFYGPAQCTYYVNCTLYPDVNQRFFLHGLWPQDNAGRQPASCSQIAYDASKFTDDFFAKLKDAYGGHVDLIKHEWDKHGTCSNLDQNAYFQEALWFFTSMKVVSAITQNKAGFISYDDLLAAYQASAQQMFFTCSTDKQTGRQNLTEIRSFWSKERRPISVAGQKQGCNQARPIYLAHYP